MTSRWGVLVGVVLLASCQAATTTQAPAVARTRGEAIVDDVRYLASDALQGRRSGSPGCDAAAAYVARRFESLGLRPGGDDGFYQRFELTVGVSLGPDNALSVDRGDGAQALEAGKDFAPLSFSASGRAVAPLVVAGYGITAPESSYDDYAGLEASGKIVLILAGEPRERSDKPVFGDVKPSAWSQPRLKVSTAKEHGAAAVLFVTGPLGHEGEDDDLPALSRSGGDVGIPVAHVRRAAVETWLRAAGKSLADVQRGIDESLKGASFDAGCTATLTTDIRRERRPTANVLGVLPGTDPARSREVLVVGAHYDHLGLGGEDSLAPDETGQVHNGADDNASGTAAVLALAKALSTSATPAARTVLFAAWSGEEEGLLGSAHYVQHPRFPIADTVAMVNLDMVGRLRNDVLYVGGVGTSPEFASLVESANRDALKIQASPEGVGPSDHTSFYLANVPVLFLFTGVHMDYHRPSDDADKIAPAGIEKVTAFAERICADLTSRSARPQFSATPGGPTARGGDGRTGYGSAYFGSVPAFGEPVEGYLIGGVQKGSPAEAAGLLAGDVMVRFDGKPITSLEDYTAVLRRKHPGDVVDFVVKRNGEEVALRATLGKRK
jgi:peptidase M28-like protein/PDZ domain-containing protein/PA domain-containing protein